MPRGVQVRPLLPAPEKGKSEQDFPFSGAAPVARDDPLRSNAKGASPPLSRSPHADLKAGSDLDRPSVPQRQKKAAPFRLPGLRKSIATREKRATIKACREDFTSAASFFLSKSEVSRGTSDLVTGDGSDLEEGDSKGVSLFWCGWQSCTSPKILLKLD